MFCGKLLGSNSRFWCKPFISGKPLWLESYNVFLGQGRVGHALPSTHIIVRFNANLIQNKSSGRKEISPPLSNEDSLSNKYYDISVYSEEVEALRARNIKEQNFYMRLVVAILTLGGISIYLNYALWDVNSAIYRLADIWLPTIYGMLPSGILDPEAAHHAVIWFARKGLWPVDYDRDDFALATSIGNLNLISPIGLAAGFDKQGSAAMSLFKVGFGFVEIGSVTPLPQPGNPQPRIFRLHEDRAIINRCGFNSDGADAVLERLEDLAQDRWRERLTRYNVLGVNLGVNKTTQDPVADIRTGVRKLGRFGDYIVINISSPNTKGLRDLQQANSLRKLILAAQDEINELAKLSEKTELPPITDPEAYYEEKEKRFFPTQTSDKPMLFVKIAPDLSMEERSDIAKVALETNVDGLIVCNTTVQRPDSLKSKYKEELGGLSGRPLRDISTECVSDMYKLTHGKIPIIACGGVENGRDVLEKIECGASAVQIYSSLIYRGPIAARRIKNELLYEMNRKGIKDIKSTIGIRHAPKKPKKISPPKFD